MIILVKKSIMIFAAASMVFGTHLASGGPINEAPVANEQMMEISCPHCHDNITVNVQADHVECSSCHTDIELFG